MLFSHLAASFRRPDHWIYASWLDTISRYRRNRLGLLWLFVPTAVYIWGIGGFMGAMQPGLELTRFFAHVGVGFAIFRLVSTVLTDATSVFSSSQAYIYDGSLRMTDFLLRSLGRSLFYFGLTLPIIALVVLGSPDFTLGGLGPSAIAFAVVLVDLVFLSVLLGLVGARLPDFHELTGSAMLALFLFTPVVWMVEAAPSGTLRGGLARANPLFHMLEAIRAPLLGKPVELLTYGYLAVLTALALVAAAVTYRSFSRLVPVWL
jgi:ABC-2 type transport system permease protein